MPFTKFRLRFSKLLLSFVSNFMLELKWKDKWYPEITKKTNCGGVLNE